MDIVNKMKYIGSNAKKAAQALSVADSEGKNLALRATAISIRDRASEIIAANSSDLEKAFKKGLSNAMLDRLKLDQSRVESMASGLEDIANLPDPVGKIMDNWDRPNCLEISRIRVPIGVIGIIYESRPNVTADAAGLCLKSGNAAILRGGSESFQSSKCIFSCIQDGLKSVQLPLDSIQIVPTKSRAAVGQMLKMIDYIDVIIPRGGKSLIERVQKDAKVPIFAHLEGICHTYVHQNANPNMARKIVSNAKMRRTGICGATETLLIDKVAAKTHLPDILDDLIEAGCEIRGDQYTEAMDDRILQAQNQDWDTEYLDSIISVKQVDGVQEAIDHINIHGSEHTDAIITDDKIVAAQFLREVNSAIVLHNTSTQFADGGEFGMGAEIGIATGKLHARGPVGIEQLTTYKYLVRGTGQIRS